MKNDQTSCHPSDITRGGYTEFMMADKNITYFAGAAHKSSKRTITVLSSSVYKTRGSILTWIWITRA